MEDVLFAVDVYNLLELALFSAAAAVIYLIIRIGCLRSRKARRKPVSEELALVVFAGYLAALWGLVWTPECLRDMIVSGNWNLEELRLFGGWYTNDKMIWRCFFGDLRNDTSERFSLYANVALFVPLGFLLPFIWKNLKCRHVFLTGFGTACMVELVQPIFGRIGDLDDVITNTLGAVIGCIAAKIVLTIGKSVKSSVKSQ